MVGLNTMAAELLESSASAYAAAALALLKPDRDDNGGGDDVAWKNHFMQRVLELAAAVRVEDPALFARRVEWLRRATLARGATGVDLKHALVCLRTALDRELPGHLQPVIVPGIEMAIAGLDESLDPEATGLDATRPLDRLALRYLASCLEGNAEAAIELVMAEVERGVSPSAAYAQVLLPAEKEVGHLWHVGDVSIAEERLVSETTRELMTLIAAKFAPRPSNGRTVLAASVATNAHDIGLRAVAGLFRLAGWRSLFLGANVPATEVARAADTFGPDLIVLNATLAIQLKSVAEAIESVRKLAPQCKVLVGGLAFDGSPELWRQLGADGFAPSIEEAVAVGAALVDGSR